jgi:hypothetical protein
MEFKKLITSASFIVAFLILLLTLIAAVVAWSSTIWLLGIGAIPVLAVGVVAAVVAFIGLRYMGY